MVSGGRAARKEPEMVTLTDEQEAALAEARETAAAEQPVTTKELVQATGALSVRQEQEWWTPRQLSALASIGLDKVPEADLMAFLHLCARSNLDPFAREIYLIGRWDKDAPNNTRYTAQTGIDGYRHIAERTNEYAGKEGPWWCGPDGQWVDVWLSDKPPSAARISVFRKGRERPFEATVAFREFAPYYKKNGQDLLMPMWVKMPAHMLAKCAEALAIRQAFPRQAAGIFVTEEMHQADAAAEQAKLEAAESQRAKLRRELVQPFGPGEPASPAVTAEGDVVEGEIVQGTVLDLSRDTLWAELETQAEILGQTIPAMTRRWVVANKRNIDDATDVELLTYIEANRHRVAEKATANAAKVAEHVEEVAETTVIPEPNLFEIDATAPHPYQDWNGKCVVCSKAKSNKLHNT